MQPPKLSYTIDTPSVTQYSSTVFHQYFQLGETSDYEILSKDLERMRKERKNLESIAEDLEDRREQLETKIRKRASKFEQEIHEYQFA